MATNAKKAPEKKQPADDRLAIEPSVRVFTRWSPQLISQAEVLADSGNLSQAAKICSWLLTDDRIRGCLSARIQGLLGLTPSFEKAGDARRSGRAIKALEAGDDWWVSYPEQELWLMLAWGLLLGVAPMRHHPQYVEGHSGRLLPFPEFWHPAAGLRYDFTTRSWKIRVTTSGADIFGVEETLEPGNGEWILHTPFGKHRPWDLGFWKCLAWWKLLKDYGRSDWARHMEKGSLLVLTQGSFQTNTPGQLLNTKQQRDSAAQDLYQRGKDAIAALAVGQDLKIVEAKGNAYLLYDAARDAANDAIAVCIRGGNLTTSVEGGGRSAAEVQERTGDFVNLRFDAETTANTINAQSLVYWAQWNFGDKSLAPWPNYPVAPQRNLKNFAETISTFVKATTDLELQGYEVDREAALEEFELTEFVKPGEKPAPIPPAVIAAPPANDNQPAQDPAPPADQQPPDPKTPEQN